MTALIEPDIKIVHAFFDCQNLFLSLKQLWPEHNRPDFDPVALAIAIVKKQDGWRLKAIHLYTGIHELDRNPQLHTFWSQKLARHKAQDSRVTVFTRPLRYSGVQDRDDSGKTFMRAREKGIDVRIALDLVRGARLGEYDVALLFSQDQDFREVAEEIRAIAHDRKRWIKIASAFPTDGRHRRGIDKTDWIPFSKDLYEGCLDNASRKKS